LNQNARKSIKGSKDLDSSLVSNENFSETLLPRGWALGQATWAKMTPKLLHLWCQSQKIHTPNQKIFFSSAIYQTGRSVWDLEQLSSAISGGDRALVRQPKTAVIYAEIKVRIYCHNWGRFTFFWIMSLGSGTQPQEVIFGIFFWKQRG